MLVHAHAKRLPHSGFVQVRFEEVAPRQAEFGDIVTRVYPRLLAKNLNWRGPGSGKSTAESQNARRY